MREDTRTCNMLFTYYCETHRDHVVTGPSPAANAPNGSRLFTAACPHCYRRMFWVPNGGTVIPTQAESDAAWLEYCRPENVEARWQAQVAKWTE